MKRLMVYEDFSSQEKTDELLDKISKYGITSLTVHEKDFLDAVSSGDDERVQNKMRILSNDTFFEDDFFKFELDDFQKHAYKLINDNIIKNILCCAHTGSGKSMLIEFCLLRAHKLGKRIICCTPIKALSNQSFYNLTKILFSNSNTISGFKVAMPVLFG